VCEIGNRQKVAPGLAVPVRDEDERDEDQAEQGLRSSVGKFSTLQQRFEESPAGKVVISGLVAVILLVGVAWNLPDSPISRKLQPLVAPVAAPTGLDQYWGMYGTPDTRLETIEVQVRMANGENRVWTMQPGGRGVGWWDRWILLRRAVIHDASVRPQLAHWVVRQVTGPNERAVGVTVLFRTENLSPPGGPVGGKSPATKVLYQEALAGPQ
jgi:hypothetical protein